MRILGKVTLYSFGIVAAVGSVIGAATLAGPPQRGPAPLGVTAAPVEPYTLTMPDCEDDAGANPPCVTFDESTWRVVTSFSPYRHIDVTQCAVEDGGPQVPCVWRDRVAATGEWLVYANRFDIAPQGVSR